MFKYFWSIFLAPMDDSARTDTHVDMCSQRECLHGCQEWETRLWEADCRKAHFNMITPLKLPFISSLIFLSCSLFFVFVTSSLSSLCILPVRFVCVCVSIREEGLGRQAHFICLHKPHLFFAARCELTDITQCNPPQPAHTHTLDPTTTTPFLSSNATREPVLPPTPPYPSN